MYVRSFQSSPNTCMCVYICLNVTRYTGYIVTCAWVRVYVYVCVCECICVYLCVHMCACVCWHAFAFVFVCVCVRVFIFVWLNLLLTPPGLSGSTCQRCPTNSSSAPASMSRDECICDSVWIRTQVHIPTNQCVQLTWLKMCAGYMIFCEDF